jgi:hypothetical protein
MTIQSFCLHFGGRYFGCRHWNIALKIPTYYLLTGGVTRLGEFCLFRVCVFTLGSFWKITETGPNFWTTFYNVVGNH